ncbi:uncharacterized protein LOC132601233 [Lycium barbarum]|uniref:uncharacterized protein LOC132601233 n=1 Tax=Lycium barbarum TaxID=112863 RepID=UPI00293E0703|nr:uncharacterized protein LOC132601233 [Lycium barbarum]
MEDIDEFSIPTSPPPYSLKQKLKNTLCFSCCFPHNQHPPPPSSSDEKPSLVWIKPNIKDKCRTISNFISNGNGNRYKRHSSSAEFRYDPLSYALNFEDGYGDEETAFRNFSSRLPHSPPPPVKPLAV